MNVLTKRVLRSALGASLVALSASAPVSALQGASGISVGNRPCAPRLPLPPADPSVDRDFDCYYWGHYVWNNGNGAGPVTGRIYWPAICGGGTEPGSEVPLPTVLLMHGDGHDHTDYDYLMRHLAFNGFIAATIQNGGSNMDRSAQALSFLEFMRDDWAYSQWVDSGNLGLIGHSRGGEAVLTVARQIQDLNLGFDVNAIISLAPTDNVEGGGVHESLVASSSEAFLAIYGTHDEDVTGYCLNGNLPECGSGLIAPRRTAFSLYDRAGSEGGTEPFPIYDDVVDKALVYIEGANHNSWRGTCAGFPAVGNLNCDTHHDLARGYMNAFLRWHLKGQEIYRYFFTGDFELPVVASEDVTVHKTFQEGYGRRVVDNFEQPGWGTNSLGGGVFKANTVTVEKDGTTFDYEPTSPHDTRSLTVRWNPPGLAPWMRFDIPDGNTLMGARWRDVEKYDYLSLRAGQVYGSPYNTPGQSKDFWVQLRDSNGGQSEWVRISDYADLPYPTEASVMKYQQLITVASSPMKTIRIPMCRFEGIDLENVNSVWCFFTASGSTSGELFMDNIEFTD